MGWTPLLYVSNLSYLFGHGNFIFIDRGQRIWKVSAATTEFSDYTECCFLCLLAAENMAINENSIIDDSSTVEFHA